ncbi:MAG: EAL domain-containing protein [Gammaproteobacteria bacterium]|nr:EAL domain-containing protein [Gammaproteobacteria bacterium]
MARTAQSPRYAEELSEELAKHTLRASLAISKTTAIVLIVVGLCASWLIVYYAGGGAYMVPHWYYIPILFAAARFGMIGAFLVALIAGIVAGPLSYHVVATATLQETSEWLTRAGFFIGIGLLMAWLVKPSLRPLDKELHRLREEFAIRRALKNGEFFLQYQPILSFQQNAFIGVEALIRWQHPARGELSPAAFVGIAEQSTLICDLSDFVIDEACRQAAEWQALALMQNKPPWYIAINLSARDLECTDLAHKVSQALERHALPAELLHIEVTESVLLFEGAVFRMRQLKKLGIKLVVDDFGTGFSSLSYLHKFPVDMLKIDRSLIADLKPERPSQALANGMVLLSKSLGLLTIAEGLETVEQLRIGKALDFDCVQGYYLAKPQNAGEIPKLILAPVPAFTESDGSVHSL